MIGIITIKITLKTFIHLSWWTDTGLTSINDSYLKYNRMELAKLNLHYSLAITHYWMIARHRIKHSWRRYDYTLSNFEQKCNDDQDDVAISHTDNYRTNEIMMRKRVNLFHRSTSLLPLFQIVYLLMCISLRASFISWRKHPLPPILSERIVIRTRICGAMTLILLSQAYCGI